MSKLAALLYGGAIGSALLGAMYLAWYCHAYAIAACFLAAAVMLWMCGVFSRKKK